MQVLIVDDDPWLCQALRIPLTRAGYEVEEAADGQVAWEAWQREHFRLVITDWMMPLVDGPELIRRIRSAGWPGYTYIIILTALDTKENVVIGLEVGADDYLTKPFSLDELRARVAAGERILNLETRLSKANERMERLATYDSLTGLLNRWAVEEHAKAELNRVRRDGGSVSLMLLDIDHFKSVNDRYGHPVGDRALRLVADIVAHNIRPYDWAGRWGGDEFLVVLPERGLPHPAVVAERVRSSVAVASLALPDGGSLQLQVSVGLTSASTTMAASDGLPSLETLIQQVDKAMYAVKYQGRVQASAAASAEDDPPPEGSTGPS